MARNPPAWLGPALLGLVAVLLAGALPFAPQGHDPFDRSALPVRASTPEGPPLGGPSPPAPRTPSGPSGPSGPSSTPSLPRASEQPTTAINGSVHVNGTLAASSTYLDGDVNIDGSAITSNLTQSSGWADYGPTTVTGGMAVTSLPGNGSNIFASNPGSSLWIEPSPWNSTGLNVLEGNIQFGDASLDQTFFMDTNGVNITVSAGQAGGFYSYGNGAASINVANYTALRNYANSTGTVSVEACVFSVCFANNVAPGAVFLLDSIDCVPLLGCLASVPSEYISWPAHTNFTILGATTTSGQGMTASLPDSRMDITVPAGTGVNISMTPALGSPRLQVGPAPGLPALVATHGRIDVSGGEELVGDITVLGTFAAGSFAQNAGWFYNDGGLTITGQLDSAGEQLFSHKLQIGPSVAIDTFPGATIATSGPTTIDRVATLDGPVVASGDLQINGTLSQNATESNIAGTLSVNGSVVAEGSVGTTGTTVFSGTVSSMGNIAMPHAFLNGTFLMDGGTFTGSGSTLLVGSSVGHGWTWINSTTYSVVGSAWLNGSVAINGSIVVVGSTELVTAAGGALRLTATVLMGTGGGAEPWTSRVLGSVLVRGIASADGTSRFNGTTVSFPNGLRVVGQVEADGNVSVDGTTSFSGAVTSTGLAEFPGMTLSGSFGLSAAGGLVNGTGTSDVAGNVSLQGTLTVDHGVFSEVGSSSITGDLTMTGTVVVTGDSELSTSPDTVLGLVGDIHLAGAAVIEGNVNTSGNVTITGSASLSSAEVTITGSLASTGTVYARGSIQLTGHANFDGPVYTLGRTSLPGLSVAGNYTLSWGFFDLTGSIALSGYTVSEGTVIANASGYFVSGTSHIVGSTVATGVATVWGESTTVGYVSLGGGASLGTYMVVNGGLSAGGLPLSGPVVLPNDTVVFPGGANISGTVWQVGLLTSSGGTITFTGKSVVNGTVVSSAAPVLQGPVVTDVLGSPFALSLDLSFEVFVAGLLVALGIAGFELLMVGWKYRRQARQHELMRLRQLRWEHYLSWAILLSGFGVGVGGGYSLGSYLSVPAHAGSAGEVALLYSTAAEILFVGTLLWSLYQLQAFRARKEARPPFGASPQRRSSRPAANRAAKARSWAPTEAPVEDDEAPDAPNGAA